MERAPEEQVIKGSENVFADLGFEHPEEELAKAKLVFAISQVLKAKKMTQAKLAQLIGIDQPQVSKLLRGRTAGYSTDRLIRILNQLGQDVEISIKNKSSKSSNTGSFSVRYGRVTSSKALHVAEHRKR